MKDGKKHNVALLLVSTLLAALGQLFFKMAFNGTILDYVVLLFLVGLASYLISTVIYILVLSRTHLSWAYGIGGLSYIFATIFAYYVLMENIPIARWIGIGVIFVGVVLVGLS